MDIDILKISLLSSSKRLRRRTVLLMATTTSRLTALSAHVLRLSGIVFRDLLEAFTNFVKRYLSDAPLSELEIKVEGVKIPRGTGRLILSRDTISRKRSIIRITNTDTMCLDRAIVTAGANLNNSVWTNSQIKNGFSRSRKLQQLEAEKLYAAAGVEINDCGNTLEDVKKFALHLGIQLNIVDADQFDIFMAGDLRDGGVVYLLKSKNHYDVITSMSGFLSKAYYWHTCKVFYSRRNTHKYESKYKCCFNFSFCSVADSLIV